MSTPVQLQSDETVIDTIKRHPVHLWIRELAIVIIVLIVLVLWYNFGLGSTGTVGTFWNVLAIGAVVVGLIMGYSYWYRYNNDIWLITSQRLVDSSKATPFSQNVTTADLLNLQDINVRQRGIAQSIFQYGDVLCQTASAAADTFEFRGVADPHDILNQIETSRTNARRRQRGDIVEEPIAEAPEEDTSSPDA